ncbi:MAG TPA: hypothetical protein PKA63_02145 [Oligoflexia bacterium]|nr:hypothetical protein [Oligoflexia bacterium]HMP47452.1 hypothetical protein [Oligoflexia bacterium]
MVENSASGLAKLVKTRRDLWNRKSGLPEEVRKYIMVDKIKPTLSSAEQQSLILQKRNEQAVSSDKNLRSSFASLSTQVNLAAREVKEQRYGGSSVKSGDQNGSTVKLSEALGKAVTSSRDAINALEEAIAGGVDPKKVLTLVSENSEPDKKDVSALERYEAKIEKGPVGELVKDLDELKANLQELFTALREKSYQVKASEVKEENLTASKASPGDLKQAKEKAEEMSSVIQFNPKEALGAYNRLNVSTVSKLLEEGAPGQI